MKLQTAFVISAAKVVTRCRRDKTFTSDDVRKIAEQRGMDVKPQSWGMAFMRCQQLKQIKAVKLSRSQRVANHGRRVIQWRLV